MALRDKAQRVANVMFARKQNAEQGITVEFAGGNVFGVANAAAVLAMLRGIVLKNMGAGDDGVVKSFVETVDADTGEVTRREVFFKPVAMALLDELDDLIDNSQPYHVTFAQSTPEVKAFALKRSKGETAPDGKKAEAWHLKGNAASVEYQREQLAKVVFDD